MGTLCDKDEAELQNFPMWTNLGADVNTYAVFQPPSGKINFVSQSKCSQQFDLTQNGSDMHLKMR